MPNTRVTRSSVLGKRAHQPSSCDHLVTNTPLTPEQTPDAKRLRISTTDFDGDSNKENVPPFALQSPNTSPATPRRARPLRRTSTEPVTPSHTRKGTRRNASTSDLACTATPTPVISRLNLATPPPTPPSLIPVHVRVRGLLRPLSNASSIAGREQEREKITTFFTSFLRERTSGNDDPKILYISGLPGTGKTALVESILRGHCLASTSVRIISINCMALQSVDALWDRLVEELDPGRKCAAAKSRKTRVKTELDSVLSDLSNKCILVLDELDHVATCLQSLFSVFSLPRSNPSCLRVVGIANTHTLTSSTSQFSNHGIDGVETVHFPPYTPSQLFAILQSRLAPLRESTVDEDVADQVKKLLPSPTLTLLTKKIAAQSGDVRSLFEVLRGAIDLAVSPSRSPDMAPEFCIPTPVVTPSLILSALKAYAPAARVTVFSPTSPIVNNSWNNEIILKVRHLGFQARLVLMCLLLASKRLEAGLSLSSSKSPIKRTQSTPDQTSQHPSIAVDVAQLHLYYSGVLGKSENELFTPASRSELGDLLGILETVGLASLSSSPPVRSASPSKAGKKAFGRTASFGSAGGKTQDRGQEVKLAECVRCAEVLRGLGITDEVKNEAGTDVRVEEVRRIWEREKAALNKDIQADTGDSCDLKLKDLFDGASAD